MQIKRLANSTIWTKNKPLKWIVYLLFFVYEGKWPNASKGYLVNHHTTMKNRIILFVACICLIIGCSCKEKRVPKDPFYANKGGWGEMNIPIIKPFHLFCYDGKNWMLSEDSYAGYDKGGCSISNVQQFYGSDSLFLFRSYGGTGVLIEIERFSRGWFIMDIKNKTIDGYTGYGAFRDTLSSKYQIAVDTSSWRTPRSYYKEFKRKGTLPWFPDSIW